MAYKTPRVPDSVPQIPEKEGLLQVGDPIGGFAGYLRRAKSSSSGLVAQFFGENGNDADVIATLHLTKHLDNWVKVTVWMVKDRNGKVTKKDGEYLKLTEFIAVVRRPQPSAMGQVAQFFGENGPNSDAINVLNKSEYLDALVYVQMHQASATTSIHDVANDLDKSDVADLGGRMTPSESQELKALQKKSEEAWKTLRASGFFRYDNVHAHLGRETDFETWLLGEACCHPGSKPCDNTPVHAWKIPGSKRFSYLPLCTEHIAQWKDGNVEMPDGSPPEAFVATQKITYLQRWAQLTLRQKLKVPADFVPTPQAVFAWALERKLEGLIPNTYKMFLT